MYLMENDLFLQLGAGGILVVLVLRTVFEFLTKREEKASAKKANGSGSVLRTVGETQGIAIEKMNAQANTLEKLADVVTGSVELARAHMAADELYHTKIDQKLDTACTKIAELREMHGDGHRLCRIASEVDADMIRRAAKKSLQE